MSSTWIGDTVGPTGAIGPPGQPGISPFDVEKMKVLFEMMLLALGHEMTFDEFTKLSSEEMKAMMRDIKLNKIIDNG